MRLAPLPVALRALERATRPLPPELEVALARRWLELPAHVKTPAQVLGRHSAGCEGTHGVFPRCNLACTPCYHSREANRVPVDGAHTLAQVNAQMAYLRERRGPGQHAQLIGGEVTLLDPDDHAKVLLAMRAHGRKPMSMTHGDFDYDYLLRLALDADGRPRFDHLAFAGHFDSMMFGRRGLRRPRDEGELNVYRERFCAMFERLKREHGITHYLAHNMTVTPRNVDQVPGVIGDCREMGFRMFSFQPAAHIGNTARWRDSYREITSDSVWAQIEAGAGTRIPYKVFQMGDERCNRSGHGVFVGRRWVPLLDDTVPEDLDVRDAFFDHLGGIDLDIPAPLAAIKLARALAPHPSLVPLALRWVRRLIVRAGGLDAVRRERLNIVTFVMHSFMDARDVRPAWELLQRGERSDDPKIRATQERLQACSYAMSHPETGDLIPACAQHSVLDPLENLQLLELRHRPQSLDRPLDASRR